MKTITKIILLIVTVLNMIVYKGHALSKSEDNINFKRITIEDGLSQTTVMCVYQDSDGYMWFGTSDGLNKYDGSKFTVYRSDISSENSIASNYIVSITEDKYHNMWVGTSNGLSKIDKKNNKTTNYTLGQKKGNLSSYNICEVFVDSKNRVWVATVEGLNLYNEKEDKFNRVLFDSSKEILTSQSIFSVVEDIYGKIWVGTNSGLNCYDESTGEVIQYKSDKNDDNSISGDNIYDLYVYNENLYIATIGDGLTVLNTKTNSIKKYLHNSDDPNGLPGDEVTCILMDNNNKLWVGTNGGLALLDEANDKFIIHSNKIYDSNSIVNDNIYSLYQDESGMIWIGTLDGISVFNPETIFKTYKNDPFDDNTIANNMIQGIYVEDNGLIWVGGKGSGLSIIDRENNKVYRYNNEKEGKGYLTSDKITCILGSDNDNIIWVGTENGLNKINKNSKTVEHYLTETNNPLTSVIRNLYIDNNGKMWISTKRGIYTLDIKTNEIVSNDYILFKSGANDLVVSSVLEDTEGYIWIGLGIDGGLLKFNPKTNEVKRYVYDEKNENSISCNGIKDIKEDSNGNLWIATNNGLNKLEKDGEIITRYLQRDGLANTFIYAVLIDEQGNPWVSTNDGISKYDIKNNKFINFNINDGLQGNEFNYNSQYKNKDGEMFFGGIRGLTSFYPEKLIESNYLAPVRINEITIDGKHIKEDDDILVKYNEKTLNIKFFMPDYRNAKRIEYAYKLEGLNKDWIYSKDTNYISYNSLPAGKYKLLVSARNPYGDWSEVSQIKIIKETAPWATSQAIFIYISIVIVIIIIIWNRIKILDGIIKQRTYELDRKLKKNEVLYKKIIENEKNKNNYFINLSHELRTPLNVILSIEQLITVLNNQEESIDRNKIRHYMNTLRSNSKRLLKLINDIIDTSKIESGNYKLKVKEHDIVYRVEELALSMKDFIENNNIQLIIDPKIEEKIIECDIDDIEKCLINIIGNAVKFTPSGGTIEINVEDLIDKVKISITDTGIGIDNKSIEEIFNRFGQAYNKKSEEFGGSGIGLELTKQLIMLHKGDLLVESEVGKGSTFTIVLPVKQNI